MSNIFQQILSKTSGKDAFQKAQQDASRWFNSSATRSTSLNTQHIINQAKDRHRQAVMPGRMYLFSYEAKNKNDLPYYDKYPLVFPFRRVKNGFYGINMHYLPYKYRAILMDSLYHFISDDNNNETTRLRIAYGVLSKFSKSNLVKPCIKHYLNSHIKSKFVLVLPNEWNTALFLPLQRFTNVPTKTVFNDSLKTIRGN